PDRKPCGACDNCGGLIDSKRARKENVEVDAAINQAVRMALSGIARAQGRFGKNIIAQMLSGSKSTKMKKFRLDKLSTFGLFKQLTQVEVAELLDMLINCGLAQQDEVDRFRPLLTITDEGKEVMRGEANARLSLESVLAARLRMVGAKHLSADDATQAEIKSSADQPQTDNRLLRRLRTWRTETAVELGWPPFRVVHDATMQRIAAVQPNSLDALLEIRGVGQQKVDQFGVQILEIVCPATCSSEEPVVVATTAVSTEKSTVGVIDETESKVDSPNDEVEVLDDVPTGSRAAGSDTAGSDTAGGELADGELAGGELADGELADGELADGELADGGSQTDRAEDVGSSGTRTRVETDGTTEEELAAPAGAPTFYWSWRLLGQGFVLSQCVQIRNLARAILVEDLEKAAEAGYPLQADWLLEPAQRRWLNKQDVKGQSATDTKETLQVLLDGMQGQGWEVCPIELQLFLDNQ
ncbi:MAG: ATP-dependent DNA helicase RecQ, partial [Pirellulaceae bacterium]